MLLAALRVWSRGSSIRPFVEGAGVGWPLSGPAVLSATLVDVAGLGVLKPTLPFPFEHRIDRNSGRGSRRSLEPSLSQCGRDLCLK